MSWFTDIFLFNPEKPLIFTQLYFWIFYAVVLIIFYLLKCLDKDIVIVMADS